MKGGKKKRKKDKVRTEYPSQSRWSSEMYLTCKCLDSHEDEDAAGASGAVYMTCRHANGKKAATSDFNLNGCIHLDLSIPAASLADQSHVHYGK